MNRIDQALKAAPEDTDLSEKHKALHSGIKYLSGQFGAATREDFYRAFGSEGAHILSGIESQGWCRYRPKHDDFVITEAGQRCEMAVSREAQHGAG